jgi:hypothetical protein
MVLDERPVRVVAVGHAVVEAVRVDRGEHGGLVRDRLGDPGLVAEQRALEHAVGGDVGQVRAGVEPRVEVDVAVLPVAQVGVHRGDVGGHEVRRRGRQQRQRLADVGGDADLPAVPVAVVAAGLVAVVALVQPGEAVEHPGRRVGGDVGAAGAGGERDLVQVLEGADEVGVAGAERQAGEQLAVAGRVHGREVRTGGPPDRGDLGRDLGSRVGLLGAREDRDGVGDQPGEAGGRLGGGHSRPGQGEQPGGGDQRQHLAAGQLHEWIKPAARCYVTI